MTTSMTSKANTNRTCSLVIRYNYIITKEQALLFRDSEMIFVTVRMSFRYCKSFATFAYSSMYLMQCSPRQFTTVRSLIMALILENSSFRWHSHTSFCSQEPGAIQLSGQINEPNFRLSTISSTGNAPAPNFSDLVITLVKWPLLSAPKLSNSSSNRTKIAKILPWDTTNVFYRMLDGFNHAALTHCSSKTLTVLLMVNPQISIMPWCTNC